MKSAIAKDCLYHLRIFYYLTKDIEQTFLNYFEDDRVTLRQFSQMAANAKDQFVVVRSNVFHASGVMGEKLIVFTYYKNLSAQVEPLREEIEALLQHYEYERE